MLFDLRGRRRRAIQVVYLTLAILMGGGLVLFGIGGNTPGGLLDAFKDDGGGGAVTFSKQIENAHQRVADNPRSQAAWVTLARLRYQQATATGYDEQTQTFTEEGRQELRRAAAAWTRYLALDPKRPDPNLGILMVQAYGPAGLNQLDKAVAAMQVVIEGREPSAALFTQLARLAYAAGQTRTGDLAGQRALSLASKDQRDAIKAQLDLAKAQGAQGAQGAPAPDQTG